MVMNIKNLIALALLLTGPFAHAEIAFTDIKGMYTDIIDSKKHLSPVHGFNWFKTGIIENMYRYGDENDATIKLVKEIFFLQPDDVTFDTTQNPGKPANYFTATTIGKILNFLETNPDIEQSSSSSDSDNESQQQQQPADSNAAKQGLAKLIAKDIGFHKEKQSALTEESKKLTNANKLLDVQIRQVKKGSKPDEEKDTIIADLTKK